jgi:hypothetical protein
MIIPAKRKELDRHIVCDSCGKDRGTVISRTDAYGQLDVFEVKIPRTDPLHFCNKYCFYDWFKREFS